MDIIILRQKKDNRLYFFGMCYLRYNTTEKKTKKKKKQQTNQKIRHNLIRKMYWEMN